MLKLIESSKRVMFCVTLVSLSLFMGLITIVQANDIENTIHYWGYESGESRGHWGEMEQDHGKHLMCREGVRQSPINFEQAPELKLGGFISYILKPRQPDQ